MRTVSGIEATAAAKPVQDKDGRLYRSYQVGGREIPVYYAYSEDEGCCLLQFPDFQAQPVYTEAGRPLTLSVDHCSSHRRLRGGHEGPEGECGNCRFFQQEGRSALIGVCACESRKKRS